MSTSATTIGTIAVIGLLASCGASWADDEPKKPAEGEKKVEQRVVVRDLRAAQPCQYGLYGDYYSRGPDEARRLIEETYRARRRVLELERQREFNEQDMAERSERLLTKHEQTLAAGLQRLKDGEADRAVVALTLAAKLNQGDPACRVHLAQARLALGHYREAGLALRRALQLQPKLAYIDMLLDRYYQKPGSLEAYTDELRKWIDENADAPTETRFLLGFLEFQRGEFATAHNLFARVATDWPRDDVTSELLEITKPPMTITKTKAAKATKKTKTP